MDKFVIEGGKPLYGEVTISGSKNAALAVIPATLICEGVCRLENIPSVGDVNVMLELLYCMGAQVRRMSPSVVEIDCTNLSTIKTHFELAKKIRASYYILGALISRFRKGIVPFPGGCDLGVRGIDQHIKGLERLGAHVNIEHGMIEASAESLVGTHIFMDFITVGATINTMLAATKALGTTIIENAAKEPDVVDVANFLNSMGADIKGAGTDLIKINGVKKLHGGTYSIIQDRIEAGTYMVAAAATNGKVTIKNVIPKHLDSITAKLKEMNIQVDELDDSVTVYRNGPLNKINLKTLPYPSFPSDMNPQMGALLCLAEGTSVLTEGVMDSRFKYVDELKSMGASISVDGKVAVIEGVEYLTGAPVKACDLRAGVAMIIAGLAAKGITEISEITQIERGYEDVVEKFRRLGANISRKTVREKMAFEKAE